MRENTAPVENTFGLKKKVMDMATDYPLELEEEIPKPVPLIAQNDSENIDGFN